MSKKLQDPNKLGLGRLLLFKSSDVSAAWINVITLHYLSMYCSDTLGINIGVVGTLLLASKIVDGFTDILLAGWWTTLVQSGARAAPTNSASLA